MWKCASRMRSLCTGGAWLVLFSPRLFPLVPGLLNLTFIFPHPKSTSTATEYDSGSVITIVDTKEARKLSYCSHLGAFSHDVTSGGHVAVTN